MTLWEAYTALPLPHRLLLWLIAFAACHFGRRVFRRSYLPVRASSFSGIYHRVNCIYAGRIAAHHRCAYETEADAETDGFRPCGICGRNQYASFPTYELQPDAHIAQESDIESPASEIMIAIRQGDQGVAFRWTGDSRRGFRWD